MELLYVWLADEVVIDKAGFNFSGKYKFDLLPDFEKSELRMQISENSGFVENFFPGNIINISAVVGANGVGKSSLLEFLCRLLSNGSAWADRYVASFYDRKQNAIVTYYNLFDFVFNSDVEPFPIHNRWRVIIDPTSKVDAVILKPKITGFHTKGYRLPEDTIPALFEAQLIFYSPAFDQRNYFSGLKNNSEYADVSTNRLLYSDSENLYGDRTYDQVEIHRFRDTLRQFRLAQSQLADVSELNIPNEIEVIFKKRPRVETSDLGYKAKEAYEYLRESGSKNGHRWNEEIERGKENRNAKEMRKAQIEKIKSWFLVNLLDNFFNNFSGYKDLEDRMFNVDLEEIKSDDFITAMKSMFQKQQWRKEGEFNFSEFIDAIFNIIENYITSSYELPNNASSFFVPHHAGMDVYLWNQRYLQLFKGTETPADGFMEVDWREMSTGEKAYLNLYSRIFYGYELIINNQLPEPYLAPEKMAEINFLYILLDEAQLGFHPLWQRQFISSLITFLNALTNKKVQVILTSHSPFVLSDLPKSNVIFLTKNRDGKTDVANLEEKSETFAANIHELFTDSFFMGEGLIGTFASAFIEKLITELSELKGQTIFSDQHAAFDKRIQLIGEPVIKELLEGMLREIQISETDDEIEKRLMEQLRQVRKRKRNKN